MADFGSDGITHVAPGAKGPESTRGGGGCMGTAPGIVDMLGFQFCMLVVVIRKNSVVVCV